MGDAQKDMIFLDKTEKGGFNGEAPY